MKLVLKCLVFLISNKIKRICDVERRKKRKTKKGCLKDASISFSLLNIRAINFDG